MPRFAAPPPACDPSSDQLAQELAAARQQVARLASERSRLMSALSSARNRIVEFERVAQSRAREEEEEVEDVRRVEQDHAREMAVARGVIESLESQCERADARASAYRADLEQERRKNAALRRQVADLTGGRRRSIRPSTAPPPSLERHQRPTVELAAVQ